MNKKLELKNCAGLLLGLFLLDTSRPTLAQTPQDNWYLEQTWTKAGGSYAATNGGLSSPYGVAIGPDGRIYVGDEGYGRIQVYLPDGTFSFSITNGFGGGQSFNAPRGMITDNAGNLYVADYFNNCVYEFTANGGYVRKFGAGTGSANGQLSGVIDVAVSSQGLVYILEYANSRLSVFNSDGTFQSILINAGFLDGQLAFPSSIAVSESGKMFISQNYANAFGAAIPTFYNGIKEFDTNGFFLLKFNSGIGTEYSAQCGCYKSFGASSVRIDKSSLLHALVTWSQADNGAGAGCYLCTIQKNLDTSVRWRVFTTEGIPVTNYTNNFSGLNNPITWPCAAFGSDGTAIECINGTKSLSVFRYAMREQWSPPRNMIPMPEVIFKQQRVNSPLVDLDFQVTDMDDMNVTVGILIFTSTNTTPSLGNCIRNPTLIEGTSTNLGPGITANQTHRLTWNAGADWSTNLGNYRVAILAQDRRTNLLDIHYLSLPAGNGMPALKISSSPLNANDFMQVWWWLLATNDTGIILTSNQIYGVTGTFNAKQLCNNGITTTNGRSYIYGKMNVREATVQEVQWAKQGNMPAGTSPNQFTPVRQVSGRPIAVNEYGFDTGSWDTNTCKWVVPLN